MDRNAVFCLLQAVVRGQVLQKNGAFPDAAAQGTQYAQNERKSQKIAHKPVSFGFRAAENRKNCKVFQEV